MAAAWPTLMARIAPNSAAPEGLPLPDGTTALSLWAMTTQTGPFPREPLVGVTARLRDGSGRYYDVQLGDVRETRQWQKLEGSTELRLGRGGAAKHGPQRSPSRRRAAHPDQPANRRADQRRPPRRAFVDGLTAHTDSGDVVVAPLNTADGWSVIEDYVRPGLYSWKPAATSLAPAPTARRCSAGRPAALARRVCGPVKTPRR